MCASTFEQLDYQTNPDEDITGPHLSFEIAKPLQYILMLNYHSTEKNLLVSDYPAKMLIKSIRGVFNSHMMEFSENKRGNFEVSP